MKTRLYIGYLIQTSLPFVQDYAYLRNSILNISLIFWISFEPEQAKNGQSWRHPYGSKYS